MKFNGEGLESKKNYLKPSRDVCEASLKWRTQSIQWIVKKKEFSALHNMINIMANQI